LVQGNPGLFEAHVHLHSWLEVLRQYIPLADSIETFWLERSHREAESWLAHREINLVMLATSLAPDGYLKL
jgi:hypothetical protein